MKYLTSSILIFVFHVQLLSAQDSGRFSFTANFGLSGNFYVRSYDEDNFPGIAFYKKNFIGTTGGLETSYKIDQKSNLFLGYMRSENQRTIDFTGSNNGINLSIWSFTTRDIFNVFYLGYGFNFKKIKGLQIQGSFFYIRPILQDIELTDNQINIWERKFSNANFNELGIFIGLHYKRPILSNLELGIQSRLLYEVTSNLLNQITLTPTLTYHFQKSTKKTAKSTL